MLALYSVITRVELFAGSSASDLVSRLLAPLREVPVERAIAERAGRVRRDTGIRLPDALIAASALERKLEVVSAVGGTSRGIVKTCGSGSPVDHAAAS